MFGASSSIAERTLALARERTARETVEEATGQASLSEWAIPGLHDVDRPSAPEIRKLAGRYVFLSPTFPAAFKLNGVEFRSVAHAVAFFQVEEGEHRAHFRTLGPVSAIEFARKNTRAAWKQMEPEIVHRVVAHVFSIPQMAAMLDRTGEARIINTQDDDQVWGVDAISGVGRNGYGKALMLSAREIAP